MVRLAASIAARTSLGLRDGDTLRVCRTSAGLRVRSCYDPRLSRARTSVSVAAGVALVLVLGAGLLAVQSGRLDAPIEALVTWARVSGPRGALALAGIMVPWVVLLLPGFLLTMAAGVVWGPWIGALVIHVPQVIGMTLAFLSGRYLFRDAVAQRMARDPRFTALDRAIETRGFTLVLLLRLSPIVPYNVLNYGLGITSVRLGPYVLASLLGAAPSTVLYTYLGASVGRVATDTGGDASLSVAWWVGLGATLVLTIWLGRVANLAVRAAMAEHAEPSPGVD